MSKRLHTLSVLRQIEQVECCCWQSIPGLYFGLNMPIGRVLIAVGTWYCVCSTIYVCVQRFMFVWTAFRMNLWMWIQDAAVRPYETIAMTLLSYTMYLLLQFRRMFGNRRSYFRHKNTMLTLHCSDSFVFRTIYTSIDFRATGVSLSHIKNLQAEI